MGLVKGIGKTILFIFAIFGMSSAGVSPNLIGAICFMVGLPLIAYWQASPILGRKR